MPHIPPEVIEQVAAANDIVEVIGGYFPLKRAGSAWRALCPFHQEKSPSFHVNPQRQSYHCFGCGAGGSVFRFVMSYENVDFVTAVKRLADKAGVKIVEQELSTDDDRRLRMRKRLLALHQQAAEWFHLNLRRTRAAEGARAYLKGRGFSAEVAETWKIGYAPESWDALGDWAAGEGFTAEEIVRSGLVKVRAEEEPEIANPQSAIGNPQWYDRFRDRVMFPICNDYGEVIAFSGRVLDAEAQGAKYVNSPETMLFTKGNVLFGLHRSKRALIDAGAAIVCEGQIDLITAFEAGVKNVIAPQGTAFTEKQARILKRYVEEVILCFDSDVAGQKAAERSLPSLLESGLAVRVAEMPPGHDPDSLIRAEGGEAFAAQIAAARDFFDYQIDRQAGGVEIQTPRGKLEAARKMAESVALVADPVMREAIVNKLCLRLEIAPGDFHRMLAKPRRAVRGEPEEAREKPLRLPQTIALLCQLALQHAPSREWLLGQHWRELLAQNADADVLAKLLDAEVRAGEASSVSVFLATLPAAEEAALSRLLDLAEPVDPAAVVRDCWGDLHRGDLRRRQDAVAARLREPGITSEQMMALQEEVMGLQKQLVEVAG